MLLSHPMPDLIKILLVEDQTLMRQGLKTILDLEPGLRVIGEASDGESGVRLALELRPDVILMDVQMPKLDGLQTTAQIRTQNIEQPIIIAMTANALQERRIECEEAGMDDYISKPIQMELFINMLEKWGKVIKQRLKTWR